MQRRTLLSTLLAGSAALTLPASGHAQVISINDAINKAGRQRMLSQRAAKSYMALGQEVMADSAAKVLAASLALFDRQLVELKAYSPTPQIRATYSALEGAWSDYKAALVGKSPDRAGAESVVALSGKVLQLANQGTVQLEGTSGKSVARLVNTSGRQRMLSQRMAAYYLTASWGVQSASAAAEVNKARDEFISAHALLKSAPEATPAIKAELELAETQFAFFEVALKNLRPGVANNSAQTHVFTTSERILQVMNNVTGMYEKLS